MNKKLETFKKYKNSISNKKLNINLYYKFSKTIPPKFSWHSLEKNKEFIPTFTKRYLNRFRLYFKLNDKKKMQ